MGRPGNTGRMNPGIRDHEAELVVAAHAREPEPFSMLVLGLHAGGEDSHIEGTANLVPIENISSPLQDPRPW